MRTVEKVGNVLQLGNVVLPVAAVLDEQREHVIELAARVSRVQCRQLPVDGAPRLDLVVRVLHSRDRLTAGRFVTNLLQNLIQYANELLLFVVEGNVGELLAACAVHGIGESRMIGVQFRAVRQDLIGESIQILNDTKNFELQSK